MTRVTVVDVQSMKAEKKKIVMMTAYYYEMARAIDRAKPDMILVGDSGGRFLLGHEDNNDVTLEEMIIMTRSVVRGSQHALIIGDMPFMTYQVSVEDAIRNAGRLVKETRCNAVKPEGGAEIAPHVEAMVKVGIPVLAHMGLTPMTSAALGGMSSSAVLPEQKLWNDARTLQEAGAFAVILTGISPDLAKRITEDLRIPTISGFGAGDDCDGDIGVSPGTLGWTADQIENPRSRYGPVAKTIYDGALGFVTDVRERKPTRSARTP
ncbi:MAG: 3-methyl-2-oxobutanoate hydroxymethyltransferase [Chloroflexi bacterium]|nr:3-methyl-2-oxobutanoate hydroxymethyltransferase [Chloroflexota bacterium]